MESKHTPGPWEMRPGAVAYSKIISGNRHIATAWSDGRRDGAPVKGLPHQANAALIATAPDLLASLEELVNGPNAKQNACWDRARAAIAKARQVGSVRPVMLIYAAVLGLACALAPLSAAKMVNAPLHVDAAACDTDTDCMRHCPPPADDPDCDGGPQDAPEHQRGNYGSQP